MGACPAETRGLIPKPKNPVEKIPLSFESDPLVWREVIRGTGGSSSHRKWQPTNMTWTWPFQCYLRCCYRYFFERRSCCVGTSQDDAESRQQLDLGNICTDSGHNLLYDGSVLLLLQETGSLWPPDRSGRHDGDGSEAGSHVCFHLCAVTVQPPASLWIKPQPPLQRGGLSPTLSWEDSGLLQIQHCHYFLSLSLLPSLHLHSAVSLIELLPSRAPKCWSQQWANAVEEKAEIVILVLIRSCFKCPGDKRWKEAML